jgi:hypothetical protein
MLTVRRAILGISYSIGELGGMLSFVEEVGRGELSLAALTLTLAVMRVVAERVNKCAHARSSESLSFVPPPLCASASQYCRRQHKDRVQHQSRSSVDSSFVLVATDQSQESQVLHACLLPYPPMQHFRPVSTPTSPIDSNVSCWHPRGS